jgi:hypothetical protein
MKDINSEVLELIQKEKKVTLGFSTGKDSLACAVLLKKLNIEFIPFFFYHCPDLEFVERNIRMYEDLLQMEVVRMPHPMLYDYLRHQDFQPPEMIYYLEDCGLVHASFEDMVDIYLDSIGDERNYYDIVGQRASESFNRRMVFKKQGFINHHTKKVSLIADWTTKEVIEFLHEENIPLTPDYKIWNRSFDGLKYQFLFGVKEHYPKDWQTIKEYFPLIELELFRYTQNQKYYV